MQEYHLAGPISLSGATEQSHAMYQRHETLGNVRGGRRRGLAKQTEQPRDDLPQFAAMATVQMVTLFGKRAAARGMQLQLKADRTLNRRFHEITGRSPLTYLHELRIERAKELLECTQKALEEITLAVGYEDLSSFRRLFKRSTGITPAQHRQQFRRARS